jgi:PAS domain S-box-containing protein
MVFHSFYYPVQDKAGAIIGVAVFVQDITESKQAEEALRESVINMRTIFENSPLGMVHFSDDGTIKDCNDEFIELMESSREKLIGFNTPRQTDNDELRAAILKALSGKTAEYEGNYPFVTGKKTATLRIVFNPTEPGMSPTEVIATLEDITERKRAEEELRQNMEDLERFSKLVVGREERMVELKNEVNELLLGLGQQNKYKIVA